MKKFKSPIALGFTLLGSIILLVGLMWPNTANAQCGSSASSCKNCHEVQGEDPVNNDGTSWHQAHAFGDFCEFCHAGNVQATDKEGAHTGMEAPLDNVQASCGNCHASDLDERAQVYAVALGVEIGSGGSSGGSAPAGDAPPAPETTDAAAPDTAAPTTTETAAPAAPAAPPPAAPSGMTIDDPNVIDYVARYNETVLGIRTVNWGNRILVGLIALTIVAGGGFVFWNEQRLRRKRIPVSETVLAEQAANYPNYPPNVVALLPRIAKLSPEAQSNLYQFLENPTKAQVLLRDMVRLEPELVKQVRDLDKESQALLLALAGSGD